MTPLSLTAAAGWCWVAGGVAIAFAAGSWVLERRRGLPRWRRALSIAAALALFLIAARPALVGPAVPGAAVLVSAGATQEQLADARAAGVRVTLRLPGSPAVHDAEPAPSARWAAVAHPGIDRWTIVGAGLRQWELEALPGVVTWQPPPPTDELEIRRVRWNRRLPLGGRLEVAGALSTPLPGDGVRLRLVGPGGVAAEQLLEAGGGGSFRLTVVPKTIGTHRYRLQAWIADRAMVDEPIGIEVQPSDPPRLLWIAGSPSFEQRHVEAWLTGAGAPVGTRVQVSRGRYRYHGVGMAGGAPERLTAAGLREVDVAVVDPGGWRSLAAGERAAVEGAVEEGLGLLLLAGDDGPRRWPALFSPFATAPLGELETVDAALEGPGLEPLPALELPARELRWESAARALVTDAAGRSMAAMRPLGRGRIAVALVTGTYRWALRGEVGDHRRYWVHLLDAVSRRRGGGEWRLPDGPVLVGEPLTLAWRGPSARVELVDPEGTTVTLPLATDPLDTTSRQTVWHPRGSGWHRLTATTAEGLSSTVWFDAVEPSSWSGWQRAEAAGDTLRRARLGSAAPAPPVTDGVRRLLPSAWWWTTLVLALTALWADDLRRELPTPIDRRPEDVDSGGDLQVGVAARVGEDPRPTATVGVQGREHDDAG